MCKLCIKNRRESTMMRDNGSYRNPEGLKYNHLPKYLLHLPISLLIVFKYLL